MSLDEHWVRPLPSPAIEEPSEGAPEASQRLVEALPSEPYRQCTHVALGAANSPFQQSWRENYERWKKRKNFDPECCSHPARVLVNGRPLCRRHAGMVLLKACEDMGI